MIKEITAQELDPRSFIAERVEEIKAAVGDGQAINALSGGVDSSTVTLLGHRALGDRLRTVFVQNGLELDTEAAEAGVVRMAQAMIEQHPDLGAFVCEGTNFSSFGPAVQEATGRPFFDIVTMTRWVHEAVVKRRVTGGFL